MAGNGPSQGGRERSVRPRPAASLVVLNTGAEGAVRVLMGRRPATMAFLPGVYVFPGGKVEAVDRTLSGGPQPIGIDWLKAEFKEPSQASSFLPCALRECLEETGVNMGAIPFEGRAVYAARAITPPSRPQRYDTRFFLILLSTAHATPTPGENDGELEDVGWHDPSGFGPGELHHVTEKVLRHCLAMRMQAAQFDSNLPLLIAQRRPKRWIHGPTGGPAG